MLAYLRAIAIGLLTLLAISNVTVAPAMAANTDYFQQLHDVDEIDWGD
jgi:hypothetical protein